MIEYYGGAQVDAPSLDDDTSLDYPSRRIFGDNRRIIDLLGEIAQNIKYVRAFVRGESPQPSIITLPLLGNTARFHVDTLTISVTAAAAVSLVSGSVIERTWQFGAADTKVLAYPIVLENGKDYTIQTTAGAAIAYFTGYTETLSEPD